MNKFESLKVGDSAIDSRKITTKTIYDFARITGDFNPVHLNEEFASQSYFQGTIAHGMLVASLVSSVLGNKLPGPGAIYHSQTLKFIAPVRPGDEIIATVTVKDLNKMRGYIALETVVNNQKKQIVLEGEAKLIMVSYLKRSER